MRAKLLGALLGSVTLLACGPQAWPGTDTSSGVDAGVDPHQVVPGDDAAAGEGDDQGSTATDAATAPGADDSNPVDSGTAPVDVPRGSAGCGQAPPGESTWSLPHQGRARRFHVRLPSSYHRDTPLPLVLSFHGRAVDAASQELVSGLTGLGEAEGFAVVYPEGTGAMPTWNAGWCCGEAQSQGVDDVGFVAAMLDRLQQQLCIDTDRVYATGLSNGAFLSYRLACELSDRIAAIGAVAGTTLSFPCEPQRPVPVQHFHGTGDDVVAYGGVYGLSFLSAPSNAADWAGRNDCRAGPTVFLELDDVRGERWSDCADAAAVELYTIDEGGHQWPGGVAVPGLGNMSDTVAASALMWQFFRLHRRP